MEVSRMHLTCSVTFDLCKESHGIAAMVMSLASLVVTVMSLFWRSSSASSRLLPRKLPRSLEAQLSLSMSRR